MASDEQVRRDLVTFHKLGLITFKVYLRLFELNGLDDPDSSMNRLSPQVFQSDQAKARAAERFAPYATQLMVGEVPAPPQPKVPEEIEEAVTPDVASEKTKEPTPTSKKRKRGGFGRLGRT